MDIGGWIDVGASCVRACVAPIERLCEGRRAASGALRGETPRVRRSGRTGESERDTLRAPYAYAVWRV